jgi:hypothetical protein
MQVDSTSNDVLNAKTSLHMSSAHEYIPPKRFRAGSVSGRLRTASDLEEIGYIDKHQKGVLKDLIISGDQQLQIALDKYEKGDTDELAGMASMSFSHRWETNLVVLLELIRKGLLERKNSIDILDTLDFDFLNVANQKRDRLNSLDDSLAFSNAFPDSGNDGDMNYLDILRPQRSGSMSNPSFPTHVFSDEYDSDRMSNRQRNSSVDSTQSFKIFDYLTSSGFDEANERKIETSHPFESSTLPSSNRIVQEFSRKDQHNIDMSAYTAVARTLAQTPAPKSGLTLSIRSPKMTASLPTHGMITTKEKPLPSMINPQYMMSFSSSSSGVPTATKHSESPGKLFSLIYLAMVHPCSNIYLYIDNKGGVGAYTAEQRRKRIDKFLEKRSRRVWTKKVKYDVRKNFADSRLRVKVC